MKVAHVITRMIVGGAQENTLHTCRDLVNDYGDEVLLITGPSTGPEGDLLTKGRAGCQVVYVPSLVRPINPWKDSFAYRTIKWHLNTFQPDVVHTHSAKGGVLGRLAAASLRVPVIVHTVHGAPFHPYQSPLARWLFRWCERYAAARCHALVTVADAMTELMVSARVAPRDKFRKIYSGLDVDLFLRSNETRQEQRRALGFSDEHVVIGKVARLYHLKGHADLIKAAEAVVKQCPSARFLFVGDGVLREPLERKIRRANLGQYFHFTGLVTPQEIPSFIGAMDVLVHTSLREGLARAIPQAFLAGKPVVSYDIDGAPEVVKSGETGFLLRPGDIDGLASSLHQLVADVELRVRFGAAGRQQCTEKFRHQEMTRQLRDLYQELLAEK